MLLCLKPKLLRLCCRLTELQVSTKQSTARAAKKCRKLALAMQRLGRPARLLGSHGTQTPLLQALCGVLIKGSDVKGNVCHDMSKASKSQDSCDPACFRLVAFVSQCLVILGALVLVSLFGG